MPGALDSSINASTGVTVRATTMEAAAASRYDSAIGGRNTCPSPRMKKKGNVAAATIRSA
jgi:hypothetical protein